MREKFDNWMQIHKKSISRSDKYSSTVSTISNHLKKTLGKEIDLYKITSSEEVFQIKKEYFNHRVFYLKNKKGKGMYSRAIDLYIEFLESVKEIEKIENDPNLKKTDKETIILSRIGQGKYRKDLIEVWKGCSLSGYKDVKFLIASHIKPWKESTNEERVDKFNGLLLLPTYDKLFDLGFITFDKNGFIIISNKLTEVEKIGINGQMRINIVEENVKYLDFHFNNIFKN